MSYPFLQLKRILEVCTVLNAIGQTYASFFDAKLWIDLFSNPSSWGLVLSLIILEGLLSSDNALVLAVMVKHLPGKQKRKALLYGLWGAYLFRFIAIGLGTTLVKYTAIKLIGAGYLLWMAIKFFKDRYFASKDTKGDLDGDGAVDQGEKIAKGALSRMIGVFWATVAAVELMDVSFSVDSILASLAVSSDVVILLLGGMLGILMMRGVAGIFVTLIERVPELEVTAYFLIAFIGVRMGISVFNIEISDGLFFAVLGISFIVTFIVHKLNSSKKVSTN